MQTATVKLAWTPSVSANVVSQTLSVKIGGADPVFTTLHPDATECNPFDVPCGVPVHCEVYASNGALPGLPVALDFTVAEVTSPEPPTGLSFSVLGYKTVAPAPVS